MKLTIKFLCIQSKSYQKSIAHFVLYRLQWFRYEILNFFNEKYTFVFFPLLLFFLFVCLLKPNFYWNAMTKQTTTDTDTMPFQLFHSCGMLLFSDAGLFVNLDSIHSILRRWFCLRAEMLIFSQVAPNSIRTSRKETKIFSNILITAIFFSMHFNTHLNQNNKLKKKIILGNDPFQMDYLFKLTDFHNWT